MCSSDTDTFSYHLQLWLNNKSARPSTLLPVHCLICQFLLNSCKMFRLIGGACTFWCLRGTFFWVKTQHTNTRTSQMHLYGIYSCLPHSGEQPPFNVANLFSSDRLVESHKALLLASLVFCSFALWQNAQAPWNDLIRKLKSMPTTYHLTKMLELLTW